MSSEEEDCLDELLSGRDFQNLEDDPDFLLDDQCQSQLTQSSADYSTESEGDPLFGGEFIMSWKDERFPDNEAPRPKDRKFKPSSPPGIQIHEFTRQMRKNLKSPIDFLKLFVTETLCIAICIATNHHAESMIASGQFKSFSNSGGGWTPITPDELWRFLGIVIFMSFYNLSTINCYWKTDVLYAGVPIRKILTRDRFKAILTFLQVVPPADVDKGKKLGKIQQLLDHVKLVSQKFYSPHQKTSIDERMLPSKHKYSGIRQFIKDKPVRFGLKLWVLACSITGYTWNFFVYLGKKHTTQADRTNGVAYSVVMKLMANLLGQGYNLYVDSFYTSLKLAKDLFKKSTYLVGTIRSNSTAMPDILKNWKVWEKRAGRGDFRWCRYEDDKEFVVVQWKDTKTVTIVSALHSGSNLGSCNRTVQQRTGWKKNVSNNRNLLLIITNIWVV